MREYDSQRWKYSLLMFWKCTNPWYVLNGGSGLIAKLGLTLCDPMDYIAHQAPLSEGFPRWESWHGLPSPPQGDLPDTGFEPRPPAVQVDSLLTEPSDPSHFMNGGGNLPWSHQILSKFTPRVSCRACSIAQVGLNQALIPKQVW